MKILRPCFGFITLLFWFAPCFAEEPAIRQDYITGALSAFPFYRHTFGPVAQPLALTKKTELTNDQTTIVDLAIKAFDEDQFALGIIMVERGQILFEQFKKNTDKTTKFFSYSMAKSLTAMTVGQALCTGLLRSLDDRAGLYAKTIDQTVFGQATLRQLLTMSSGARAPDEDGGSLFGEWNEITGGRITIDDLLKKYGSEKATPNIFVYNNSNTNALMLAVNGVGNFAELFDRLVWKPSGPEQSSTWLTDREGGLYVAAGFGAAIHDWARLAMRSIALLNTAESPCMAEFMQQATTRQTSDTLKQRFWDYGYQTWVTSKHGMPTYSWQGAYGQHTLVSPKNERILIIFRYKGQEQTYRAIGGVFSRWVRMPEP